MYTLHITGTESEVKDYERKFEGGQWLPFGETATLEDSTNKADPVSHHNRYTPVCMKTNVHVYFMLLSSSQAQKQKLEKDLGGRRMNQAQSLGSKVEENRQFQRLQRRRRKVPKANTCIMPTLLYCKWIFKRVLKVLCTQGWCLPYWKYLARSWQDSQDVPRSNKK